MLKQVSFIFLVLIAFQIMIGCTSQPTSPQAPSAPVVTPTPAPSPTPAPTAEVKPAPDLGSTSLDDIRNLANGSKCAKFSWPNGQGVMKKGYTRGVALTYAKFLCSPISIVASPASDKQFKSQDGNLYWVDALKHYEAEFKAKGMSNTGGLETSRHAFNLLLSLGTMESSGKLCSGRDMGADFSSADSAEAGAWQTSWGLSSRSQVMKDLYAKYSKDQSKCFKSDFADGAACKAGSEKNWGDPSSEGYKWQKLTKECPAFAAEYALVGMRVWGGGKGEWGPLRKKLPVISQDCDDMFSAIEQLLIKNTKYCQLL